MGKIFLEDVERWKKINKENGFSLFDYVFHSLRCNDINSDIFFAFSELIWPAYTKYEGYYLLKENFSEIRVKESRDENMNVEYWINLLLVDSFFENDANLNERASSFANLLARTWGIKLKKDFPEVEFIVEQISDETNRDYGVTFYQANIKGNSGF